MPKNADSIQFFFLNGLKLSVFPKVYEPSEDSFLLAENVEIAKGCSVLDLGTGSGIQGISAAAKGAAHVVCTDVNENALKNAEENAEKAGFSDRFEFRQSSLFDCVKQGERFDVIVFNPPYVPSKGKRFVDLDGGKKGREILDKFLAEFPKHLKKNGACFFLQSSLNGEKETANALEKNGFEARVVARKRVFFEELVVFRAGKRQSK
ncbi:MAG: HemK2/MTQ2 family protein methyltransferase [archaeon]